MDLELSQRFVIASAAQPAGVEISPADQPYGVRDCAVSDPSGNMVRFSAPLGRSRT